MGVDIERLSPVSVMESTSEKGIVRKISDLAIGNFAAILINGLSFFVLTRVYSPTEFGEYGLFLYFASIFSACSNFCFHMLIPTIQEAADLGKIVGAAFINIVISAFISLPIGWLYFGIVGIPMYKSMALLTVYILSMGLYLIGNALLINGSRNQVSGFLTALNAIFVLSFQVVLSFQGLGWVGLVTGNVAALVVTNIVLYRFVLNSLSPISLKVGPREYVDILRSNANIWTFNIGQTFVNAASVWVMASSIRLIGGNQAVGIFALSQKLLIVPVRVVGMSVRQVFLRELSLIDIDSKIAVVRKSSKLLAVVATALMAAVYVSSPVAVLLLPERWNAVDEYAFPMSIWLMMTIVYTPAIGLVNNLKKAQFHLYYELINVGFRVLVIALMLNLGRSSVKEYLYFTSIGSAIAIVVFVRTSLSRANLESCKL